MISNQLYTCDNLFLLNGMNSASVDLIYLDPPFNSKRFYSAPVGSKSAGASFKDMWVWDDVNTAYLEKLYETYPDVVDFINTIATVHSKGMGAYITYMTQRLIEMHRVLKPDGSLYLHVDPTASHYLKIILDAIFGKGNFRNEIVWCYHGPGSPNMRQFNRKTDHILWYSKGDTWTFNKDAVRLAYKGGGPHVGGYGIDKEMAKDYGAKGKVPENWWVMRIAARSKTEYMGYPTQKPIALLHRIIEASSNEGDVVFDPFCGCATACVVAQQLHRKWIGCDIEGKAADILVQRLADDAGLFQDFVHLTQPPTRTDVHRTAPTPPVKERLYKDQNGKCNGCQTDMEIRHLEIDHIVPKSKGGGDYYENYQLLCGHCNRMKSNKTMDYLRAKLQKVKENRAHVTYM